MIIRQSKLVPDAIRKASARPAEVPVAVGRIAPVGVGRIAPVGVGRIAPVGVGRIAPVGVGRIAPVARIVSKRLRVSGK